MSDLLLELLCEEIPARMQARAADDLQRLLSDALAAQGIAAPALEVFATARRLTLIASGLPSVAPDVIEEKRGPRVDAPQAAQEGFLKATGLNPDQLEIRDDPKGRFFYAVIQRPGRPVAALVSEIVPAIIHAFPWPKSMRWGAASASSASLRWVRPLQSVLCLLDGAVVPFEIDGLRAGAITRGHRFLSPSPFSVDSIQDYRAKLRGNSKVILDPAERMKIIDAGARKLADAAGLELVEDAGLLAENAGLTEWPVPLMGSFDPAYLAVPPDIIQLTMRTNQKYFALRDPATGQLAARFICVANIEAPDGGKAIIAGNERVLSARLADARFFWESDLNVTLDARLPKLEAIVFHEKLGTMAQRVARIEALALWLVDEGVVRETPSPLAGEGCLRQRVALAARLCKADLVSGVVGEFPEVQGIHGGYLATAEGLDPRIADAIAHHYAPRGPDDAVPTAPETIAIALAEKLDTLVGFFAIGEKPTGSKDPFALRRAALGVIRLITDNALRLALYLLLRKAYQQLVGQGIRADEHEVALLDFFADRLKVQQREAGVRHDLIDAVFSLGGEDDLVRLLARVSALQAFIATDDGANLLAGARRALNILRIEEKKDGHAHDGAVDPALLHEPAERALYEATGAVRGALEAALAIEDFAGAMAALSTLRAPVDAFFDTVTVNADDATLRANRLALLGQIRASLQSVADIARIEA